MKSNEWQSENATIEASSIHGTQGQGPFPVCEGLDLQVRLRGHSCKTRTLLEIPAGIHRQKQWLLWSCGPASCTSWNGKIYFLIKPLGCFGRKVHFLRLQSAIFIPESKGDMGTTGNKSMYLWCQYINKMFENIFWGLGVERHFLEWVMNGFAVNLDSFLSHLNYLIT